MYDENGVLTASSPPIGLGFRWRHQLALAPFGPSGEMELATVLTPHIGGVVEFFNLEGASLNRVGSVPGFTSHVIGSRNLDMAIAGDFDGDGRLELLVPNQSLTELGGIQRIPTGAELRWTVPLAGRLSTNLAAVASPAGRMVVAAGTDSGILRFWLP